jgi:hypothetical protein
MSSLTHCLASVLDAGVVFIPKNIYDMNIQDIIFRRNKKKHSLCRRQPSEI